MKSGKIEFIELAPAVRTSNGVLQCQRICEKPDNVSHFTVLEPEPQDTRYRKEARLLVGDQEIHVSNNFFSALEQLQYLEQPRYLLLLDLCARLPRSAAVAAIPCLPETLRKAEFIGLWKSPPYRSLASEDERETLLRHAMSPLSVVVSNNNLRHYSPYSRETRLIALVCIQASKDEASIIDCKTVYACWPDIPSFTLLSDPGEEISLRQMPSEIQSNTVRLDGRDRKLPYLKCEALRTLRHDMRSEFIIQYDLQHYPFEKPSDSITRQRFCVHEIPRGFLAEALATKQAPCPVRVDGVENTSWEPMLVTLRKTGAGCEKRENLRCAQVHRARSFLGTWIDPESFLNRCLAVSNPEEFAKALNKDLDCSKLFMKIPCFPPSYRRRTIDTSPDSSEIRLLAVDRSSRVASMNPTCRLVHTDIVKKHPPYIFHPGIPLSDVPTDVLSERYPLHEWDEITVDGVPHVVPKDLYQLICAVQHKERVSYIWSATLCVNWWTKKEHLHHSRLIAAIHRKAMFEVQLSGQLNLNSILRDRDKGFQYPSLDKDRRQIRLLRFEFNTQSSSEVECHLAVQSLETADYTALSYCWGPISVFACIRINGKILDVAPSVRQMLLALKGDLDGKWFWVDAICINQADPVEKGHQVAMMAEIYHRASSVIVWLGAAMHDSDKVLGLLEEIVHMSENMNDKKATPGDRPDAWNETINDNDLSEDQVEHFKVTSFIEKELEDDGLCYSLIYFLRRPWWERLWTFQEAALARHVVLRIGTKRMSWQHFEKAHYALSLCDPVKRPESPLKGHLKEAADDIGKVLLLSQHDKIWRREIGAGSSGNSRNGFRKGGGFSLLAYISILRKRKCSNPADYVYCTMGLANDGLVLDPDYKKSVLGVYLDFTKAYISQRGDLDVLRFNTFCRRRHLNLDSSSKLLPSWPSWLPDWRVISSSFGAMTRLDMWSGDQQLDQLHEPFPAADKAAGDSKASPMFSHQDRVIYLKGYEIGRIAKKIHSSGIAAFSTNLKFSKMSFEGKPMDSVNLLITGENYDTGIWDLGWDAAQRSHSAEPAPLYLSVPKNGDTSSKAVQREDAFNNETISEPPSNADPLVSSSLQATIDNRPASLVSQESFAANEPVAESSRSPFEDHTPKTELTQSQLGGEQTELKDIDSLPENDRLKSDRSELVSGDDPEKPQLLDQKFVMKAERIASIYQLDEHFSIAGADVFEKGDIVCVLFGGRIPFVLRPWGNFFLMVGTCKASEWMNGEALERFGNENITEFGLI